MTAISISNISKTIKNRTVLDNLNFEVRKNEIFALPGPNGAGKTTLIKIICGLISPDSGEIQIPSI